MSTISDDPLRFLKPRKKQFHLTPTKVSNKSPKKIQQQHIYNQSIGNRSQLITANTINQNSKNSKENLNIKHNIEMQSLLLTENVINKKSKQLTSNVNNKNNNNKNNEYNPQKYFSLEVQNYFRNKKGLPIMKKTNQNQKQHQYESQQQQQQQQSFTIEFNKQVQKVKINQYQEMQQKQKQKQQNIIMNNKNKQSIHKHVEPQNVTSILMLETKHDRYQQQQERSYKYQINNKTLQQYQTIQSQQSYQQTSTIKANPKQVITSLNSNNKRITPQQQQQRQNNHQYQQHYQQQHEQNNHETNQDQSQSNQLQLKPCPICSRKFNSNSYQRHIQVCEKVFYKKRKQFSSQKQRSLSSKRK